MLEAVFLIWLAVGFVGLIIYSFTESETPGLIESAFFVLIGPAFFIWMFFSWIGKKEGEKSNQPSTNYSESPLSHSNRRTTSWESPDEKYKKLESHLAQELKNSKHQDKVPSKKTISDIQRLGERSRSSDLSEELDYEKLVSILVWGLESISTAYKGKDQGMGARRRTAIQGSLEKVCEKTGREVPSIRPSDTEIKSEKQQEKKAPQAKSRQKRKTPKRKTARKKSTSPRPGQNQARGVNKSKGLSEDAKELLHQFLKYPMTTSDLNDASNIEFNLSSESPEAVAIGLQEMANVLAKDAESGDANSQWAMGAQHELGLLAEQDDSKAFEWHMAAAEQGFAPSQHDIAILYKEGRGVEQDPDEWLRWMTLAADQGYPIALNRLGEAYELGRGVEENQELSSRYYLLGAENGDPASQCNIGGNYLSGRGIQQDAKEAIKWFKLAAKNGVSGAQYNLGNCYWDGIGTRKNRTQAVKWYRAAAAQGNMDAQYNLAVCYVKGEGVQQNKQKALELLKELADQGDYSVLGKIESLEDELGS